MTTDKQPFTPPKLERSLNTLRFKWDNGVSLELYKLNDKGTAEIWARYKPANSPVILLDVSDLNLLARRSRDEYARLLAKQCAGQLEFDWDTALRWIVPTALEEKRKGEPVIELGLADQHIEEPIWDAYPLVVAGMPNILFGDRGSLKSKLALVLALIMQLPYEENDLGIIAPPASKTVLKLDFEATKDADEYEWRRLLRGMGMEVAVQLKYRLCRRPLADDIETIVNHADAINAKVLIIDSLGAAVGGDLIASEPALRFFEAVRQLNRTTIIPAHTAKNPLGKRSVYGNIYYENLARNIWEVTKEEDEDSDSVLQHIALHQTKTPPFARHHPDLAYEFEFDDDAKVTLVRPHNPASLEQVIARKSMRNQLMMQLKSGNMTPAQLAEETGRKANEIRQVLFRLKKAGKVVKLPDGSYGLAENNGEEGQGDASF